MRENEPFEYVIVGAGLAGSVIAQNIATRLDKKVLIIEQRHHIGGNCYDYMDKHGILVHQYGPHLFHTDSKIVVDYLSRFTAWHLYQHKVLANIDGIEVPLPFNLNTIDALFPASMARRYEEALLAAFDYNTKVPILDLKQHDDPTLSELADYVYEKVFLNYTVKQWGILPEDIDPMVTARVPIFIGRDDRYFNDRYQMLPKEGYTSLFEQMLHHRNIKLMLNTDVKEVMHFDVEEQKISLFGADFKGKVIFTGRIDDLFDYCFDELPYRSLDFDFETLEQPQYQPVTTVNYPNDHDFTRITEFKHLSDVKSDHTTIVKEYPKAYDRHRDVPYYPIFTDENKARYSRYASLAERFEGLYTIGRLAEYRYYDMDDVVLAALTFFEEKLA